MVVKTGKMDINKICEELVSDITGKSSISKVLLKTQLLAVATGVEDFRQWVNLEQNGYGKPLEVPDYRKLHCNVTAVLSIPFHTGQTEMNVPIDAIQYEGARKMLSTVFYDSPALEAERIAAISDGGHFRKPAPAMGYQFVQPLFPNAHLEFIYQDLSPTQFASLVETVKSRILSLILDLDKEGIIKLSSNKTEDQNRASKIYYQTFNRSVVNNGVGNIEADNNVFLSQDTIPEKDVHKLKTMFSRLNVLVKEEKDPMLRETAEELNKEINTESPKKSVVKKGFAIIKGLAMGVASREIATIINAALGIL